MALLEEAGVPGLAVTMYAPDLQEIALLAEVVQSQLRDIGMDITLGVESTATFYDRWCLVYDSDHAAERRYAEPVRRRCRLRHRRLRQPWHARPLPGGGLRDRRVELCAL